MVKTAVAVFLCFAIDAFRGGGIPFYSAIAAVLCLQPSWQSSTQKARERTVATFLGGLAGMLVLAAVYFCYAIGKLQTHCETLWEGTTSWL